MSQVLHFQGLFNKEFLGLMSQPQLLYAYFEIRPNRAAATSHAPLNFSLLLDRSGSMSGEKIKHLREAVKRVLDQLQPEDFVSLIAFNTKTELLAAATSAAHKENLKNKIDRLKADGGTDIGPAMKVGLGEIHKVATPDKINRLILLTDGETNNEKECQRQADEAGRQGVPIIALGLGTDWNETLLEDLVARGGANGYADLIKRPEDVAGIFQEVLNQMKVVAQDLAFRLLLVQGVEARRVWQVSPLIKDISFGTIQGRTVAVSLPELAESGAAFLIELLIPPRNAGSYRFAQAEIGYNVPTQRLMDQKERINLMAEVTPDPMKLNQVNGTVMNIVEKVTAFRLQTQALDDAAAGNIAGATQKLRAAHTRLLEQGELELAQTVLTEARRLEQGHGLSNEGRKTMKLQSRKTVKLSEDDTP
ncbi:MAG: VWA domain-containing protein [Candidatus Promineifilaceae bacterium]|nr:VWA domain-containing protein [Chloroflexota bacterium]